MKNKSLKRRLIEISWKKKLSHLGSCLTAVDIIDDIYNIKKPEEKMVLSSGHAGLALYVVLEKHGGKDAEDIFNHHGVHPDRCSDCGIDCSAGSLGHGIGIAVGMALADRSKSVYCLISDGECAEGSVWEALNTIRNNNITNINISVNHNNYAAYMPIDNSALIKRLNMFAPNVFTHYESNFNILSPILREPQEAHYKVMEEVDFNKMMEVLK